MTPWRERVRAAPARLPLQGARPEATVRDEERTVVTCVVGMSIYNAASQLARVVALFGKGPSGHLSTFNSRPPEWSWRSSLPRSRRHDLRERLVTVARQEPWACRWPYSSFSASLSARLTSSTRMESTARGVRTTTSCSVPWATIC